jgi:hypothetical protein
MTSTPVQPPDYYCPYCSQYPYSFVVHSGKCPKVKSIEYHNNGTIKKVEFND